MNNVLNKLENEFENIARIRENLFEVKLIQLHPGIDGYDSPESYGIYKNGGGQPLGVVGKQYAPQNLELILETLTESMIEASLPLSSLTFNEYKGGQIVEFGVKLKDFVYDRSPLVGDITSRQLNIRVGLNGQTKTTVNTYATRLWCTNGATEAVDQIAIGFKNTKGNVHRAPMLCSQLIQTIDKSDAFNERLNTFIDRKVTAKQAENFLLTLLGESKLEELSTTKKNMLDAINASVSVEANAVGFNLFSLVQGVTRWTTHERAGNDVEAIKFSKVAEYNQKAFQLAESFALTN